MKKLNIRHETIWKVVKKVQRNWWNMQPTRSGQKMNSPNEASGEKIRGKCWKGIHVVLLQTWLQKQESVKLQCVESSKKISEPILTKCRKWMNFQPLRNIWDLTDVNTIWILWKTEWCPICCSLMRRNLTFNNALTTKIIEFGVEMDQCKAGE